MAGDDSQNYKYCERENSLKWIHLLDNDDTLGLIQFVSCNFRSMTTVAVNKVKKKRFVLLFWGLTFVVGFWKKNSFEIREHDEKMGRVLWEIEISEVPSILNGKVLRIWVGILTHDEFV